MADYGGEIIVTLIGSPGHKRVRYAAGETRPQYQETCIFVSLDDRKPGMPVKYFDLYPHWAILVQSLLSSTNF